MLAGDDFIGCFLHRDKIRAIPAVVPAHAAPRRLVAVQEAHNPSVVEGDATLPFSQPSSPEQRDE